MLPSGSLLPLIFQFSELLCLEGWDFPQKGRCQGFRARWKLSKRSSWPQGTCLWEERAFSCMFTSWASNLAPNVPHTETGGCCSEPYQPFTHSSVGRPGRPWSTSCSVHFCLSCGPCEMDSHVPAAFHLTPLGTLTLVCWIFIIVAGWGCRYGGLRAFNSVHQPHYRVRHRWKLSP